MLWSSNEQKLVQRSRTPAPYGEQGKKPGKIKVQNKEKYFNGDGMMAQKLIAQEGGFCVTLQPSWRKQKQKCCCHGCRKKTCTSVPGSGTNSMEVVYVLKWECGQGPEGTSSLCLLCPSLAQIPSLAQLLILLLSPVGREGPWCSTAWQSWVCSVHG